MPRWAIPEIWEGGDCWIIGGGPSMPRMFGIPEDIIDKVIHGQLPYSTFSDYMEVIKDKHVIGINNSYQLGDWIDVLYFSDSSWYLKHRANIARFAKLKVTSMPRWEGKSYNTESIKYIARSKKKRIGINTENHEISWNANSGGSAINIAYYFGVKRIFLLGYDLKFGKDKFSHWHGSHGAPGQKINKYPFKNFLERFPVIAEDAKELGLEIYNVTNDSVIDCFPKISLEEALNI